MELREAVQGILDAATAAGEDTYKLAEITAAIIAIANEFVKDSEDAELKQVFQDLVIAYEDKADDCGYLDPDQSTLDATPIKTQEFWEWILEVRDKYKSESDA